LTESEARTGSDPVQIYEDPFINDEEVGADIEEPAKPVLEELPINERTNERPSTPSIINPVLTQSTRSNEQNVELPAPQTPTRTPHTRNNLIKPQSAANSDTSANNSRPDAETLRSRRLLASGIERIRARTLDAHGFRRVQDLVKNGGDIWGEESARYGELLLALLAYLESSSDSLRSQNLKIQVLATVRAMLSLYRREAAPYYGRALCSVLAARRWFEDMSHVAAEMEKACDEIVRTAPATEDCLVSVLEMVEGIGQPQSPSSSTSSIGASPGGHVPSQSLGPPKEEESGVANARTVTLALRALEGLLAEAQKKGVDVSPGQTQRLGQLAVRFLHDTDADVRRADLEFCLALHERFGGEGFWKAVVGVKEMHLNLITYYLARRGRA
jgi:CLIP-associating protein 1/2